ncbi:leucine rich repeat LRR-containing protein [Nitzschia inconspicua]|uniref:Leucine rich repeat LRR-containing protein n=1 Tax=Nitzschia inconspicua TaxID=303405 RepID=A0A9K3L8B9_9STRA|nr:leucine rich repeat LRR-containing protein [Nitzschia inconspicua]
MAAANVSIRGTQLHVDGSFNPRWGDGNYPRLSKVLHDAEIFSVRLFQVNFSCLDQAFVTLLGTVLKSRVWDRIYLAYCSGTMPDSCLKGCLLTKQLEVYGPTLNLLPILGHALTKVTSPIECLRLRTRLQQDDVIPVIEGLKASVGLKKLYLTCAFADEESAVLLSTGLAENRHLQLLSLYSCEMENEVSMERILSALRYHPTITTLEIRDNNASGITALSLLVQHTTTLENLDLYLPPVTIQQVQVPRLNLETFSEALRENTSIKSLALANNGLRCPDILHLILALQRNKTLQRLNLQGNLISDEGIQALARSLPHMSLKELCLWNNPFTATGAEALLGGLRHPATTLQAITTFSRYPCTADILYCTHLNRAGRGLLYRQACCDDIDVNSSMEMEDDNREDYNDDVTLERSKVPIALWATILGRVNEQRWSSAESASVIYTLLKEGPVVVESR